MGAVETLALQRNVWFGNVHISMAGSGFLSAVSLLSAVERFSSDEPNGAVEQCVCPEGYVGQFCESCGPGYYREEPHGGPFTTCIPCNCNNHSDDCDVNTGKDVL